MRNLQIDVDKPVGKVSINLICHVKFIMPCKVYYAMQSLLRHAKSATCVIVIINATAVA